MFVAVRDVTLCQAGYDSLSVGAEEVGLTRLEVALTRNLRVPHPDSPLTHYLDVSTPDEAAHALDLFRAAGLELCALFLPNNFLGLDPAAEVEWTAAALGVAESLEVPLIRIEGATSGVAGVTRRRRVRLYVEALHRVLDLTPGSTVSLAIENHGRQGNEVAWLEETLAGADSDRVGITLDPANLYWAGCPLSEVYALVARWAPAVRHLHVKNIAYPEQVREERRPLGWEYGCCVAPVARGDLDYHRIAATLAAAGYRGALALEDESLPRFPPAERPGLLREARSHLEQALFSTASPR